MIPIFRAEFGGALLALELTDKNGSATLSPLCPLKKLYCSPSDLTPMCTEPDPVPSDAEMVPLTPAAAGPFTEITGPQLRQLAASGMSSASITAGIAALAGLNV